MLAVVSRGLAKIVQIVVEALCDGLNVKLDVGGWAMNCLVYATGGREMFINFFEALTRFAPEAWARCPRAKSPPNLSMTFSIFAIYRFAHVRS